MPDVRIVNDLLYMVLLGRIKRIAPINVWALTCGGQDGVQASNTAAPKRASQLSACTANFQEQGGEHAEGERLGLPR